MIKALYGDDSEQFVYALIEGKKYWCDDILTRYEESHDWTKTAKAIVHCGKQNEWKPEWRKKSEKEAKREEKKKKKKTEHNGEIKQEASSPIAATTSSTPSTISRKRKRYIFIQHPYSPYLNYYLSS